MHTRFIASDDYLRDFLKELSWFQSDPATLSKVRASLGRRGWSDDRIGRTMERAANEEGLVDFGRKDGQFTGMNIRPAGKAKITALEGAPRE